MTKRKEIWRKERNVLRCPYTETTLNQIGKDKQYRMSPM